MFGAPPPNFNDENVDVAAAVAAAAAANDECPGVGRGLQPPVVTLLNKTAQDYALATGLLLDGEPDALFANKQVPSDRGWSFHADGEAHGYEVVTVVLTMRSSDCLGGVIEF